MPEPIIFQISSWDTSHDVEDGIHYYIIYICGTTNDNKKICVTVKGFTPLFYVKIPSKWNNTITNIFVDTVTRKVKEQMRDSLHSYKVIRRHSFTEFTNYKKYKFVRFAFHSYFGFKAFENVLKKKIKNNAFKDKTSFRLFESNLEPHLRYIHMRNLESCGWAKIDTYEVTTGKSNCALEIEVNWKDIHFFDCKTIAQLTIASFDLECKSSTGSFPQPENADDPIIQIGTTFSRYGESDCYYKHLTTLKSCNKINNVVIESFGTEGNVILGWAQMIQRMDPDILTGYNIFQFDYHYIMVRAKKFGIEYDVRKALTRIKSMPARYVEKPLNSSALGDNLLKFYDMPGRTQIDIMKLVQRDFKLASYSLDNVASEFIKEKIVKVVTNNINCDLEIKDVLLDNKIPLNNTATIVTTNTYGLEVNAFIKIYFNDNFSDNIFDNNKKYKIIGLYKICKYCIIVIKGTIHESINELLEEDNNTVYWTQAKDDLKYSEMFEMQEKTGFERAIIGKYCVQDCALCNILMNKLEVLNNNIAMANVTNVPLSYIFLKGQGVKIFSLIAKKCRERNHLIPVLKRKNKTEEELEEIKRKEKELNKLNRKRPKKNKNLIYEMTNIQSFMDDSGSDDDIVMDNDLRNNDGSDFEPNEFNLDKLMKAVPDAIPNIYDSDSDDEENKYFKDIGDDTGYEGATVLDPDAGIHHTPIPVLDYASLYPSSMIEKNLSHECLLLKPEKYYNAKTKEIYDFNEIIYYTPGSTIENKCTFVVKKDRSIVGILPEILQNLIDARAATRDLIGKTDDPFQKKVLDGRQLALKITANSLYGQTGAPTSPVFLKSIAASTTATGRERLMAAKKFAEQIFILLVDPVLNNNKTLYLERINTLFDTNSLENIPIFPGTPVNKDRFNRPKNGYTDRHTFIEKLYDDIKSNLENKEIKPKCIYGDSIVGSEPLILLNPDGVIEIKKIEDLIDDENWKPYNSFKTGEFNDHFIDILHILFNIKKVNQHDKIKNEYLLPKKGVAVDLITGEQYVIKDIPNHKLIYDIIDHEFIESISYEQIGNQIVYNLMQQLPAIIRQKLNDYELSFINGNEYDVRRKNLILVDKNGNTPTSIDSFIDLFENLDSEKEYAVTRYKVWTDDGWQYIHKVIRHHTNKQIFRVNTCMGIVDVTEDHSLLDNNKQICKPISCTTKTKLLHSFPTINNLENLTWDRKTKCGDTLLSKKKVKCLQYYFDCTMQGLNMNIAFDKDTKKYKVFESDNTSENIISIENITKEIPEYLYVYDLETSNGHYNAGIGSITLKNTDSIFINFNILDKQTNVIMKDKAALAIAIKLGILCSRLIGLILPFPQDLQYEKTLWPFIIITKKRYVGRLYETDVNKFYQKSMGLSLKRRDYAPIAKIIVGKIVNTLLNDNDSEKAITCTKEELSKILSCKYPIDKFILSKTLRSEYADRTRIVHAVLADRIAERDPGNKPQSSDRIQYVYIVTGKKMKDIKLQGERVEDPTYVIDNKLQIDYLFYITNQILKPAVQFLEYIVHDPIKIFQTYITIELNRRTGVNPITKYIKPHDTSSDEDVSDLLIEKNSKTKNKRKTIVKKVNNKMPKVAIKTDFNIDFTLL